MSKAYRKVSLRKYHQIFMCLNVYQVFKSFEKFRVKAKLRNGY